MERAKAVFLLTTLLLLLSLIPGVYAVESEDVVDVSQFPNNLAQALNVPLFAGQLLASVILMCFFLFPTMMLTHGKTRQEIPITFVGIASLSVCIALGWTPYFVMLLIVMMVAFAYADKIRTLFSGK